MKTEWFLRHPNMKGNKQGCKITSSAGNVHPCGFSHSTQEHTLEKHVYFSDLVTFVLWEPCCTQWVILATSHRNENCRHILHSSWRRLFRSEIFKVWKTWVVCLCFSPLMRISVCSQLFSSFNLQAYFGMKAVLNLIWTGIKRDLTIIICHHHRTVNPITVYDLHLCFPIEINRISFFTVIIFVQILLSLQ